MSAAQSFVCDYAGRGAPQQHAHELLFGFGIVCDLIAGLGCLLAALAFYELFKRCQSATRRAHGDPRR